MLCMQRLLQCRGMYLASITLHVCASRLGWVQDAGYQNTCANRQTNRQHVGQCADSDELVHDAMNCFAGMLADI